MMNQVRWVPGCPDISRRGSYITHRLRSGYGYRLSLLAILPIHCFTSIRSLFHSRLGSILALSTRAADDSRYFYFFIVKSATQRSKKDVQRNVRCCRELPMYHNAVQAINMHKYSSLLKARPCSTHSRKAVLLGSKVSSG
jgi:hypothetical protein